MHLKTQYDAPCGPQYYDYCRPSSPTRSQISRKTHFYYKYLTTRVNCCARCHAFKIHRLPMTWSTCASILRISNFDNLIKNGKKKFNFIARELLINQNYFPNIRRSPPRRTDVFTSCTNTHTFSSNFLWHFEWKNVTIALKRGICSSFLTVHQN